MAASADRLPIWIGVATAPDNCWSAIIDSRQSVDDDRGVKVLTRSFLSVMGLGSSVVLNVVLDRVRSGNQSSRPARDAPK